MSLGLVFEVKFVNTMRVSLFLLAYQLRSFSLVSFCLRFLNGQIGRDKKSTLFVSESSGIVLGFLRSILAAGKVTQ